MGRLFAPRRYAIRLDVDRTDGTFRGDVRISGDVSATSRDLVLDAVDLDVAVALVDGEDAAVDAADGRLRLRPRSPLGVGSHVVEIGYRGRAAEVGRGLVVFDDGIAVMAQPTFARTVFPCVDRPSARATFAVEVSGVDGEVVASPSDVPMPPHLLGVAVGPFETTVHERAPWVRLHRRRASRGEVDVDLVLAAASASVRRYEELLGTPYPFPTLDLVVLSDMETAGMEATGIVFLRESAVAAAARSAEAVGLVAHEVAHQWFGSLLAPVSWRHIWLNEGFATWLAPQAVESFRPDLVDDIAEVRALRRAIAADRPLLLDAATPAEILALFDDVAYRKGAAMLRLLDRSMGADALLDLVRRYVARHAGGAVTTDDLLALVDDRHRRLVVPLLHAAVAPAVSVVIDDDELLVTTDARHPVAVPIAVGGDDGGRAEVVVPVDREARVRPPLTPTWAFANAGGDAYHRSVIDDPVVVAGAPLTPAEDVAFVHDLWDGMWAGELDVVEYLEVAAILGRDGRAAPDVALHLADLADLLARGPRRRMFDRWRGADTADEPDLPPDRLLDAGLSTDDVVDLAGRLLARDDTAVTTWALLRSHWPDLRRHGVTFGGRGLIATLSALADGRVADEVEDFFADAAADERRAVSAAAAAIRRRSRFRDAQQPSFDVWLAAASAPPGTVRDAAAGRRLRCLLAGFEAMRSELRLHDAIGLPPPDWKQPASALEQVVVALRNRHLAWAAGRPGVSDDMRDLEDRLREDLVASAAVAEGAAGGRPAVVAVVRAAHAADLEARLDVVDAVVDGDRDAASAARRRRRALRPLVARAQAWPGLTAAGVVPPSMVEALADECRHAVAGLRRMSDGGPAVATPDPPPASDVVVLPDGERRSVTTAMTAGAVGRGYPGRPSLDEGAGLLLCFPDDGPHRVWMHDVAVDLDVAWIDGSGVVRHVERAVARDPAAVPRDGVHASGRYVLELPAGASATHGVVVGATIRFA